MHSEKILEISLLQQLLLLLLRLRLWLRLRLLLRLRLRLRLRLQKRSGWLDPSQSANESPVPGGCPGAAPRPCAPVVVVVGVVTVAVAVAIAMISNDEQ